MKIRCRECKTIYDNSEKYCPYCFTRTNAVVRYKANVDNNRVEGSVMKKRVSSTYNYQKRATTKYKAKKNKIQDKESITKTIAIIIAFIVFVLNVIFG